MLALRREGKNLPLTLLRINLTARLARLGLCRRFFVEAILTLHRAKESGFIPLIISSKERHVGTRFDFAWRGYRASF